MIYCRVSPALRNFPSLFNFVSALLSMVFLF
jgi:hypothetical protein